MITITDNQLQELLNHRAANQEGMNKLLGMVLNSIMYAERKQFLKEEENPHNKANGYRPIKANGYGRQLSLAVPRDRLGTFQPLLTLVLKEQEQEIKNLCFALYKEGITTRRLGKITEQLYGKHYSRSAVSEMNQTFKARLEAWRNKPLEERYVAVYLDAIHTKVMRGNVQGEAFYVALAVRSDKTREIICIKNNPVESAMGWEEVLEDLKSRGVKTIDIVIADGIAGLEEKVLTHFPRAKFQKCVTHFKRNILYKMRPGDKQAMVVDLASLFNITDNSYTKEQAYARASELREKWKKQYPFVGRVLSKESLRTHLTCLDLDFRVRSMIYTTNWIERLHKEFRRALKIRNAMPHVDSVLFLLSAIAVDMENNVYSYPVNSLSYEPTFFENYQPLDTH